MLAHGHVCECHRERVVQCMHMGVCVRERESTGQMNARGRLSVCVLAHGSGVTRLSCPETRDAERAVPATWGGKLDFCWTHWGWHGAGPPGAPGIQTAGTPGWGLTPGAPEAAVVLAGLKGCGKGSVRQDLPNLLALC